MSKTKKILIGSGVAVVVLIVLMGSLRGKDRNLPRVTTAKVEKKPADGRSPNRFLC